MELNKENILKALAYVVEPDLKKDIVELNLVHDIKVEGNKISFSVQVNNPALHNKKRMQEACEMNLHRFLGADINILINVVPLPKSNERPAEQRTVLPNVKNIIAIASGKGGVGKSTITSNLAAGLALKGYKVGLIDADIYGPSAPMMFDVVQERPGVIDKDGKNVMIPVENYGVKMLSIGFFAGQDQAVVWRGPMATKALTQMINDSDWGELDYMLIDLPPGTGDIHLTLVQALPLTGVVIVSTPQDVALADARKGIGMFRLDSIKVPVLGIVENMSYFTPDELPDNKYYIFGQGGAVKLAEELNVPVLGEIPLVQSIREAGDVGRPAILQGDTPQAIALTDMVDRILAVDKVTAEAV
jgi:ATP-binding protein involved in chromosome partitioning